MLCVHIFYIYVQFLHLYVLFLTVFMICYLSSLRIKTYYIQYVAYVAAAGFLSHYLTGRLPYVTQQSHGHIFQNRMLGITKTSKK